MFIKFTQLRTQVNYYAKHITHLLGFAYQTL